YESNHRTQRRSTNKAAHTLIHSRPSLRRLPPLAHYSSGTVAHFYFGANTARGFFCFEQNTDRDLLGISRLRWAALYVLRIKPPLAPRPFGSHR
ncbi:MAG: hypothetical protein J0H59_19690, partial [Comamonadaceae bacterium]|nr:hypothetical protein [Comamonadaceae bacterium]